MARTSEGRAFTDEHRRRQIALRAAVLFDLAQLWSLIDPTDQDSFDRLARLLPALIRARTADSIGLSSQYFRQFREAELVDGVAEPVPADIPDEVLIQQILWSAGYGVTRKAVQAGLDPRSAARRGLVAASGSMGRVVLDGGRNTIARSTRRDPKARGWVRVTDHDPCAFCALLAGRGPVFTEPTVGFRAHDHCSCTGEPSYPGSEWPGRAREFGSLYESATREAARAGELDRGTSNDLLNAFRRAYERG